VIDALGKEKGGAKVGELYTDIQVMAEFGLDPWMFGSLHRWDRLALRYFMLMRQYLEKKAADEARKKAKKGSSGWQSKLPSVA